MIFHNLLRWVVKIIPIIKSLQSVFAEKRSISYSFSNSCDSFAIQKRDYGNVYSWNTRKHCHKKLILWPFHSFKFIFFNTSSSHQKQYKYKKIINPSWKNSINNKNSNQLNISQVICEHFCKLDFSVRDLSRLW